MQKMEEEERENHEKLDKLKRVKEWETKQKLKDWFRNRLRSPQP